MAREPAVHIEGTTLHVGRHTINLRFLTSFRTLNEKGETEPKVRVYCQGCQRRKVVGRVGLRYLGRGVVDLQPYCHECRSILSRDAKKAKGR